MRTLSARGAFQLLRGNQAIGDRKRGRVARNGVGPYQLFTGKVK
jgi:hypothetical protein